MHADFTVQNVYKYPVHESDIYANIVVFCKEERHKKSLPNLHDVNGDIIERVFASKVHMYWPFL